MRSISIFWLDFCYIQYQWNMGKWPPIVFLCISLPASLNSYLTRSLWYLIIGPNGTLQWHQGEVFSSSDELKTLLVKHIHSILCHCTSLWKCRCTKKSRTYRALFRKKSFAVNLVFSIGSCKSTRIHLTQKKEVSTRGFKFLLLCIQITHHTFSCI